MGHSYYQQIRQVKIVKVPVKMELRYWLSFAGYVMPFAKDEEFDRYPNKCWKATLAQVLIKIGAKQEKYGRNLHKEIQISLTPAEKFALEELLYDAGIADMYLSMICQQLINQIDAFEVNQGIKKA